MRKTIMIVVAALLLASCTKTIPKELGLKKTTDMFTVYYPAGWEVSDGLGGGVTITNPDGTIGLPIGIQTYPGARNNDVNSIPEILSIFQKPTPGGQMWIKSISGHKCIWAETDLFGQKLIMAYVPLQDTILSIQTQPRKSGEKDVTAKDLNLAQMIIENLEIK